MTLLDFLLPLIAPIGSILVSYLLLRYFPIKLARKQNLKKLIAVSKVFKNFYSELKKGSRTIWGLSVLITTMILIYVSLLASSYYYMNQNIYLVPFILLFAAEIELVALSVIEKKASVDPVIAYDLKTNSDLLVVISLFVLVYLYANNAIYVYMTTLVDYTIGFGIFFVIFIALAFYIYRIEDLSNVENFIFKKKYSGKVHIEVVTKNITFSGYILDIGQFLLIKSESKTQVLAWHEIIELALINESLE